MHHWLSRYTLSMGACAFAALAAFLVHEARTPHPMVPLGLFRTGVFSAANAVYALAYASLSGVFFFVTLYFQNVKGWSALETGLSWIPLNAPFLAVAPFAGRIVKRWGAVWPVAGWCRARGRRHGRTVLPGCTLPHAAVWPYYVLLGLGYGLLVPAVSAAAMATVPADHSGVGSGILNSARQVGAAVGLAVLGSISVARATREWHAYLDTLPAAAAATAAVLVQQAAGEAGVVAATLGQQAVAPALSAFLAGYRGRWSSRPGYSSSPSSSRSPVLAPPAGHLSENQNHCLDNVDSTTQRSSTCMYDLLLKGGIIGAVALACGLWLLPSAVLLAQGPPVRDPFFRAQTITTPALIMTGAPPQAAAPAPPPGAASFRAQTVTTPALTMTGATAPPAPAQPARWSTRCSDLRRSRHRP